MTPHVVDAALCLQKSNSNSCGNAISGDDTSTANKQDAERVGEVVIMPSNISSNLHAPSPSNCSGSSAPQLDVRSVSPPPTTPTTTSSASPSNTKDDDQPLFSDLTFLVEVVKATIPAKRKCRDKNNNNIDIGMMYEDAVEMGMHCTVSWIGPINPSGRKRRVSLLHRTKTWSTSAASQNQNASAVNNDSGDYDEREVEDEHQDCVEHIFTVNDASLFLFRTSMKQLVNASLESTSSTNHDDDNDIALLNSGGLRFDIFEKPLDIIRSVYSTLLADSIFEMEENAITSCDGTSSSSSPSSSSPSTAFSSYRLVGSVFLTPNEILSMCNEQRFECDVIENCKMIQCPPKNTLQQQQSTMRRRRVNGARLALRIRLASDFDIAFMKTLGESDEESNDAGGINKALRTTFLHGNQGSPNLKLAKIVTDIDENVLAAKSSMRALGNLSPIAQESVRYLFSDDIWKRIMVKPYPDPNRIEETTWYTEEQLQRECYKPSTNWIQAGGVGEQCADESCSSSDVNIGNSLGQVYLEVLKCEGLPNVDAGGSIGNKSDPFVSIVYGDIMVQTEVIDDSCSPIWPPWSTRAFVFQMKHPSTAIYLGVADYDVGPMEHECIGRISVHLGKFSHGVVHTLVYNLYESPNLVERGEAMGTITLRLRIEIPDEKRFLLEGWKAPERKWVNSLQWKSHRVAKFCVDGPHDEEVFEMSLFRSHINEILAHKRHATYVMSDAVRSLIFWRGQIKVGNVWLPLHSAVVFYLSIHVVENLHLLPSFILFGCGWIMIANMLHRVSHPNPWKCGHSFAYYWNILVYGQSSHEHRRIEVQPHEGHKEANDLEKKWRQRLADDDAKYAKQLDLDAKIKTISDDAIIRTKTKAKANAALVDPISAVAGARLLPYQQRLAGYCNRIRYIRSVLNWNESIISFFTTLIFFGAGIVALFIPWRFLLQWASRLIVWIFLGPWMRLFDLFFHEETERQKANASKEAMKLFHQQQKTAKMIRENALKMKALRVKLFGKYITRLPEFNLTRHEDVPLPVSWACHSEGVTKPVEFKRFVPSQDLSGSMIPMIGQDKVKREARKRMEQELLFAEYQQRVSGKSQSDDSPEEDTFEESVELIESEDRMVCYYKESPELDAVNKENDEDAQRDKITTNGTNGKAIQLTMGNQIMTPTTKTSSKWVFSASIEFSLKREMIDDVPASADLLCDDDASRMIDQIEQIGDNDDDDDDVVTEEGVEIVPFSSSNEVMEDLDNDDDNVAVLYLKDDTSDSCCNSIATEECSDVLKAEPLDAID